MDSSSDTRKSRFGGQKAVNLKVRNFHGTLKKVHINDDNDDSGSGSGSDAQPWWEEHLSQEEQRKKRRQRQIERERQRRLRRSWIRGQRRRRGDGVGAKSEPRIRTGLGCERGLFCGRKCASGAELFLKVDIYSIRC